MRSLATILSGLAVGLILTVTVVIIAAAYPDSSRQATDWASSVFQVEITQYAPFAVGGLATLVVVLVALLWYGQYRRQVLQSTLKNIESFLKGVQESQQGLGQAPNASAVQLKVQLIQCALDAEQLENKLSRREEELQNLTPEIRERLEELCNQHRAQLERHRLLDERSASLAEEVNKAAHLVETLTKDVQQLGVAKLHQKTTELEKCREAISSHLATAESLPERVKQLVAEIGPLPERLKQLEDFESFRPILQEKEAEVEQLLKRLKGVRTASDGKPMEEHVENLRKNARQVSESFKAMERLKVQAHPFLNHSPDGPVASPSK